MRPKRIILIRHGESEGNTNHDIYATKPDHKLELTEKGRQQAQEVAEKIKPLVGGYPQYYVSSHTRSRQTYEEIAKIIPGRLYEDPRLREQEWGHLREKEQTEKLEEERYAFGTFHFRFPDGESGADVYDRVTSFIDTMFRDFEKGDYPSAAVVVTHGLTIRLFVMRWFHVSYEVFESWKNPKNCQFFVMERDEWRYSIPSEFNAVR